jgi:hypothetical protein
VAKENTTDAEKRREEIEKERHELARLIGTLLAWDWLERRAGKEKTSGSEPPEQDEGPASEHSGLVKKL